MASIARGIIGGLAGAAGDVNTQQQMAAANQQAEAQKQNELKAKIAPLSLAVKNLQTGIQTAYSQYKQQNPQYEGDFDQWKAGPGAQQFGQFVDQTGHAVHSMREILHPDYQAGPTEWLKTHLTDRMHITNADHRAEDRATDAAWNKYDEGQFTQAAANKATPYAESAAAAPEQLKQKNAMALEGAKAGDAKALEGQKLQGQFALQADKIKSQIELEDRKIANAQTIEDKKTAEQTKIELMKQAMFNRSQERIERMHNRAATPGTWQVQEDEKGQPILFNSKTGQTEAAPEGMHKSGYYAKQVAPLEAAQQNVNDYMSSGQFTGPGDLDLQHQFFIATAPATGFRMTKVQQDLLEHSQSLLGKGEAALHGLTHGTIFSDEQRRQIADETQKAISAKKRAMGGQKTDQLNQSRQDAGSGPSDDDIIKALSGSK